MTETTSRFYEDITRMDQLLMEDSWEEVSQILQRVAEYPLTENQEVFIAISALRLTWIYREFLSNWNACRDLIASKLKAHGYVVEKSMFGLL